MFTYYMPAHVIVDAGGLENIGSYVPASCKRVLIVTGSNSAAKYGYRDTAVYALEHAGFSVHVFEGVEENPSYETVNRITELAREKAIDGIVGLGGGSPMDAAKAAALCASAKCDAAAALAHKPDDQPLFFMAVPTTAGTGSEVTQYALLTDTAAGMKENVSTPKMFPDIAVLDAEVTVSMSQPLTRDTGIDALSHAVEGFISVKATPVSDASALYAIEMIAENLPRVLDAPRDIDGRQNMLIASSLAGIVIAQTGTTACHALGYYLTLHKGLRHGHANAVLLGRVMEWTRKFAPERVELVEKKLGSSMDQFVRKCGIDTSLSAYNVECDDIDKMIAQASGRGSVIATPGTPDDNDLKSILMDE